jgi:hypothetical protein
MGSSSLLRGAGKFCNGLVLKGLSLCVCVLMSLIYTSGFDLCYGLVGLLALLSFYC